MTIEELKSVSLLEYLSRHGCKYAFQKGKRYWYNSPIREGDLTPSFKVDVESNLWYDFGLHRGGNIINLVKEMHPHFSNHEALKMLEDEVRIHGYSYAKDAAVSNDVSPNECKGRMASPRQSHTDQTRVVCLIGLSNTHLLEYVSERHVSIEVAQKFCREVHYQVGNGRYYYAIAFLNVSDGMEARNKYSKRCIGGKDISVIRSEAVGVRHCCVFEGFFDFLSYATMKLLGLNNLCIAEECDCIVLNSVNNIGKAFPIVERYEYIHSYLDNDNAGHKATETLSDLYLGKVIDESYRYQPHNDLNDMLRFGGK